ncbi:hypothetical protein D5086_015843 [Populus alba]|uniref:Uncharacterized protein n=1 Tax=Populus alba TaxID=43335 RepID=A0ACC4BTY5_POPAL
MGQKLDPFPDSGKFRVIAIISFKTEAAAKRALAFDGFDMRPCRKTRANKGAKFSPGIVEGFNRIYVGNLSWDITEDGQRKCFSDCKISSIRFGNRGHFLWETHQDKLCGSLKGAKLQGVESLLVAEANIKSEATCGTLPPAGLASQIPPAYLGKPELLLLIPVMAATNPTDRGELSMANKYRDRETSPDRTKMTILPKSKSELKVAVVYYLTRNGQFEHPHFMEVPLSSPQGLQLKGGSLLLETSQSFRYDTTSSRTSKVFSDIVSSSSEDSNPPAIRRKNRSWTTFDDLEEYKVYKAKITGEIASEGTHNVSTQTDDNRRVKIDGTREIGHRGPSTMLGSKEEASKPSLKSSSKAVESLEVRSVEENGPAATIKNEKAGNDCPSGRMKPSVVLMKLVGCGSKRFSNKN